MAEEIIKIDGDLFGDIQPTAAPKSDPGDDPMGLKIVSGEEKGISINLDENLGSSGAMGIGSNDNTMKGPAPLKTLGEIDADATKKIESTAGVGEKPSGGGGGGGLFSNFSLSSGNGTKKVSDENIKTQKELDDEKNDLLAKLTVLERRGVNLSRTYDMNSSLEDVRAEYGRIKATRELENSVKFQRKMLMASVTAIEFLNNRFDPFDVELEGWSETVHENVDEYDEVFEELYEKYKGRAQIAPEIKLMMMLGGSAFMFHLTKTMFKSSIPGMDEILKQNPEIARQVASAAAKTMSGAMGGSGGGGSGGGGGGGGGGGFNLGSMMGMMGNLMGGGGGGGRRGPAPSNSGPSRQARAAPSQRPDMEGPGNVDDILRELDQSSVGTANQARGVSVGRGDGNTRVSVERSDANTLILNV